MFISDLTKSYLTLLDLIDPSEWDYKVESGVIDNCHRRDGTKTYTFILKDGIYIQWDTDGRMETQRIRTNWFEQRKLLKAIKKVLAKRTLESATKMDVKEK